MEIKFTPWRIAYIQSGDAPASNECILCVRGRDVPDVANLVLFRGAACYVIMNLYPYNTGHLMVVPYLHTADLVGLEPATAEELFSLTRQSVALLTQAMAPHGF